MSSNFFLLHKHFKLKQASLAIDRNNNSGNHNRQVRQVRKLHEKFMVSRTAQLFPFIPLLVHPQYQRNFSTNLDILAFVILRLKRFQDGACW